MKLLFVNACVRPQSRTLALCKEYIRLLSEQCDVEITEIDPIKSDMRSFSYEMLVQRDKDIADNDFSSDRYFAAKAFAEADAILIGAPYWDLMFPAALKAYLERVCVCGISFHYTEHGSEGLCRAKELTYLTTAGGFIGENNFGFDYLRGLCGLLGIPKASFACAEGLDIDGMDAEGLLARGIEQVRALF